MSLTGNLEDLPLLDILQVVSFSKKTGWLSIQTSAGEGAIVFEDGLVVAAFTWDSLPLDARASTLGASQRQQMLRDRMAIALERLIRLREGDFSFSLTDSRPAEIAGRAIAAESLAEGINPQELLLDLMRGMDEDRRDSTAAVEMSFSEPPEVPPSAVSARAPTEESFELDFPERPPARVEERPLEEPWSAPAPVPPAAAPASAPTAEPPVILLVDDEADVRRILAEYLTQGGHQVVEADEPETAVKRANRLGKAGMRFVLLCDLGMPASGGASFQGGFEVVKRLGKMHLHPPVILMTESLSAALHARAKQMGIARVVFKPGLSKLDPQQFQADLRAFAAKVLKELIPGVIEPAAAMPAAGGPGVRGQATGREAAESSRGRAERGQPPGQERAADSLRRARTGVWGLREPPPAQERAADSLRRAREDDLSRELVALRERLQALREPGEASRIAAIVMQVAREFFERGVLFVVKHEEARGIAAFGAGPRDESLHLLVRDLSFPLSEPSALRQVVETGKPFHGPLPEGRWTQTLLGRIGRFRSSGAALLPLITNRETIAVLYGDNPETGRPPERLESLEVFVTQAGIALENAFLQRKLKSLQGRDVG